MTLTIHRVVSGPWKQNGYVIANALGEALLLDPGGEAPAFEDILTRASLRPLAVINTHGHFDHIGAVAHLADRFGLPFFLHRADWTLLRQANFYKILFGATEPIPVPRATNDLAAVEADLTIGGFTLQCLPTPGHTHGSVCLLVEDKLFSGDTLLRSGAGRVDLPGGSAEAMRDSIDRVLALPRELEVYPGHGRPFRLGDRTILQRLEPTK